MKPIYDVFHIRYVMIYKINRIQQKSILFPNHKRQNFLNRPWNKTKNREESLGKSD